MLTAMPADAERLKRINALLEQGLGLPRDQREAWLAGLTEGERTLALQIKSLLERATDDDTFMRLPVVLDAGSDDNAPPQDQAGDTIGPYRLVREIGHGGMGTVWLAERMDGAMQRQVALKLPRTGWALGLAQRMARERDILAALEHPHIARLYDAGTTGAGRPWLAMEHVQGLPIDEHCRTHALDVPQRVRLFLQVVDAVAHAHARLVVHRDLKPSNILVTPEGQVRLLDFGVAKLLEDDVDLAQDLTQQLGRAVTPDYVAPEQLSGARLTVAADVYSLGVVLYELLTDERPYRLGRVAGPALEQAIREADVVPASSRVSGDRHLARLLRGDLDTIVGKALRKDPARRYTSAEAMADDLRRHLDGLPVLARPSSRRYRARKFIGRHRWPMAAGAGVSLSLLLGLGVAVWQAQLARAQAERAERVKEFVASMFRQAAPRQGVGGPVSAFDLLDAAASRIEAELSTDARVAAELGLLVGEGFSALGESRKGLDALRAAADRAEASLGRRHRLTVRAKAFLVSGLLDHDLDAAERLLTGLVDDARAGLPESAELTMAVLRSQSFLLAKRDRVDPSIAALREAIALGERHLGADHPDTVFALGLLANTQGRFGQRGPQLASAEEAMRRAQATLVPRRPDLTLSAIERWHAEALSANDRPADAVQILRRVLHDQRTLDASTTPRVRHAMVQLAAALNRAGQTAEALPLMLDSVALEAAQNPTDSDDRVAFADHLVRVLLAARKADDALPLLARSSEIRGRLGLDTRVAQVRNGIWRARLLALQGDSVQALALAQGAAELAGDANAELRDDAWIAAAFIERTRRRPQAALSWLQRVFADPQHPNRRLALQAEAIAERGALLTDLGDVGRAEADLLAAQALYAKAQVEPTTAQASLLVALARVYLHTQRADRAEALLRALARDWQEVNPHSAWHGETLHWLAHAEAALGRAAPSRAHRRLANSLLEATPVPMLQALRDDAVATRTTK